eukprot:CAMPEP_0171298660 /NCGR_PEP_ID=MMETSP0816-20121228/7448_1 /TAXON_ID=420281 /ORGANISM="Proboscia inermis, Strain CCAP1064/1" /LENGTH=153 /DNA_ID=CAMNT_0011773873 /DNA_START=159 /DNA_END=617 /DNA_ORIENTATION=-
MTTSLEMSAIEFVSGINSIRRTFDEEHPFLCFMTSLTAINNSSDVDARAMSILDETWDIAESELFDKALIDCIDATFDTMKYDEWNSIFYPTDAVASSAANLSCSSDDLSKKLPLVQIVTMLQQKRWCKAGNDVKSMNSNAFILAMKKLRSLQ